MFQITPTIVESAQELKFIAQVNRADYTNLYSKIFSTNLYDAREHVKKMTDEHIGEALPLARSIQEFQHQLKIQKQVY